MIASSYQGSSPLPNQVEVHVELDGGAKGRPVEKTHISRNSVTLMGISSLSDGRWLTAHAEGHVEFPVATFAGSFLQPI